MDLGACNWCHLKAKLRVRTEEGKVQGLKKLNMEGHVLKWMERGQKNEDTHNTTSYVRHLDYHFFAGSSRILK